MNLGIPVICNSGVGDVDEIMNECMPELLVKEFTENEYQKIINCRLESFKNNLQVDVKNLFLKELKKLKKLDIIFGEYDADNEILPVNIVTRNSRSIFSSYNRPFDTDNKSGLPQKFYKHLGEEKQIFLNN